MPRYLAPLLPWQSCTVMGAVLRVFAVVSREDLPEFKTRKDDRGQCLNIWYERRRIYTRVLH